MNPSQTPQSDKCKCCRHRKQKAMTPTAVIAVVAIALALVAGGVALYFMDIRGDSGSGLAEEWKYKKVRPFDKELLAWRSDGGIRSPLHRPNGLAYREGRIYLVSNDALAVLDRAGNVVKKWDLPAPGRRVDVDQQGMIYVTSKTQVNVFNPDGVKLATWPAPSDKSQLLAVAVVGDRVAVSDIGTRTVYVYDKGGALQGDITGYGKGFILPSDNFELADTPDGTLLVANSGKMEAGRIEAYDPVTLEPRYMWGRDGEDIIGFNGCCNPTGIVVLDDGRVATTEKTLTTIKVFTDRRDGSLSSVVAGPESLGEDTPWDIAVDDNGRLIVLFTDISMIRIFAPSGDQPDPQEVHDEASQT